MISAGERDKLVEYETFGSNAALFVPTAERYLPYMYVLALKNEDKSVEIFNDSIALAAITRTSVKVGWEYL